ncbi:MAG: 16S rRNA (adenine(1518)-N(6)/adenine(1519)-N(6))-dimethyltransferase RsmA [Bacteroidia bacterium]|nr:16S rRNA (adenine(1518)-N(6)/adenine(1519)-N(6))-dimethyltransferase RsmA [Bacteroidia bacterium]
MKVKPKKHLGQHFLRDFSVAKRMADMVVNTHLPMLEIGAGTGVLTQFLVQKKFNLHAVEIDMEAIQYLKHNFAPQDFTLYEQDFLTLDISALPTPIVWIGNLPYNISSQVFFKLWENCAHVPEAIFMVQKEVALRLSGKPNSKEYGILSVLLQLEYQITYAFTVPPHVFEPPPKVYSGVIHLIKKTSPLIYPREKLLKLVKVAFNQRRKILKNSIKSLCNKEIDIDINGRNILGYRAEQLPPEAFLKLLDALHD